MQEYLNRDNYTRDDTEGERDFGRVVQAARNAGTAAVGAGEVLANLAKQLPIEENQQAPNVQAMEMRIIDFTAHFRPFMNPWLSTAGVFADDPDLLPMLDEIYAAREAIQDTGDEDEDNVR